MSAGKRFDETIPGGSYELRGKLVNANGEPVEGAASAATPAGPTVKELRAQLDELGVEVPRGAKKADLEALLAEHAAAEDEGDGDQADDPNDGSEAE